MAFSLLFLFVVVRIIGFLRQRQVDLEHMVAERTDALRNSEARLSIILDSLDVAILIIDAQTHRIVQANPKALSMIEAPEYAIVGNVCHLFVCPAEEGKCPISDLGQTVNASEKVLLNAHGKEVPILKSVVTVAIDRKEYLVESFVDLSSQKAAESKLAAANEQLSKAVAHAEESALSAVHASQAMSRFLANMSHEIRTPLNAIIGFSNIIKKSGVAETQRQFLDIITSSGKLLLSIINDVLDYSKIESGKLVFESIDIDLRRLMSEMIAVVALKVDPAHVRLGVNIDSCVPAVVCGDPTRLKQIMLNLLSNAVKFTQQGEITLSVSVDRTEADRIVLSFLVTDTGVGIPADRVEMIFSAFEQADTSVTRKFGGTGLGLAIARSLVMLMGGEISVVSEQGKGSVFSFTVVVRPAAQVVEPDRGKSLQGSEVTLGQGMQGLRVLAAEDIEQNRRLIAVILSSWGAHVEFVHNGADAADALRRGGYDLCLMDVQMPQMSGIEATQIARNAGVTIPIIALTASASQECADECRAAGMTDFVSKPLDETELHEAMRRAMQHGMTS
jgi:signal transduction histidine kinase/BarA-like signal transduction histidine kinase